MQDESPWRCLKTDPPTGKEYAVILWPQAIDVGFNYIISNPQYAIKNGLAHGFLLWYELPLAPDHDNFVAWCEKLYEDMA